MLATADRFSTISCTMIPPQLFFITPIVGLGRTCPAKGAFLASLGDYCMSLMILSLLLSNASAGVVVVDEAALLRTECLLCLSVCQLFQFGAWLADCAWNLAANVNILKIRAQCFVQRPCVECRRV